MDASGGFAHGLKRLNFHPVLARQAQQAGRQGEARIKGFARRDVAHRGLPALQLQRDFWLSDPSGFQPAQQAGPINKSVHADRISVYREQVNKEAGTGLPYSQAMKTRSEYGSRLKQARAHANLTQKQLAAKVGMSQSNLSELEISAQGSAMTPQLAAACNVNVHWLATGAGDMLGNPSESRVGLSLLAHAKILDAHTVVPTKTREQLMQDVTEEAFEFTLDDDALAPDYVKGTPMVWSTTKKPAPGSALLLLDAANRVHVRLYAEGRAPGQWLARAPNPNFATFDLSADQLRIVAVAKWQPMP